MGGYGANQMPRGGDMNMNPLVSPYGGNAQRTAQPFAGFQTPSASTPVSSLNSLLSYGNLTGASPLGGLGGNIGDRYAPTARSVANVSPSATDLISPQAMNQPTGGYTPTTTNRTSDLNALYGNNPSSYSDIPFNANTGLPATNFSGGISDSARATGGGKPTAPNYSSLYANQLPSSYTPELYQPGQSTSWNNYGANANADTSWINPIYLNQQYAAPQYVDNAKNSMLTNPYIYIEGIPVPIRYTDNLSDKITDPSILAANGITNAGGSAKYWVF